MKIILDSIVPITRFYRGGASKIFEEVSEVGVKVVLKNNVPIAVLLKLEQYEVMVEMLEEDYALFFEAEKRTKNSEEDGSISNVQVLNTLGISESALEDVDVEIE